MARATGPTRRAFLKLSAGGAVAGWLSLSGCGGGGGAGPADLAVSPDMAAPPFDVEEATIADLAAAMASGRATSRALCERYLQRIAELDEVGPELRALLEVNPDALAIADTLDAERSHAALRGPLHGVPILIKGNVATADKMSSTAGSLALVGETTAADATLVTRLRAAGAVILGKSNLSEWANFRSSRSLSGWSAQGGQCRNAYSLDRDPSGSSSGSAVGVAASLAAVAVGTETDGSITSPSSVSCVVGLKPTVGLVSRWGIIPISATQDTAGPIARSVRDAALLLGAMAGGADLNDPATMGAPAPIDYAAMLDPDGLRGVKIGLLPVGTLPVATAALADLDKQVRALGALVSQAAITTNGQWRNEEFLVMQYEFKAGVAAYLKAFAPGATVQTLADLIAFNNAHADTEMQLFGQDIFTSSQARGPLTDPTYVSALARCGQLARVQGLDAAFAQSGVDALACVTAPPTCPAGSFEPGFGSYIGVAAVAGYPHVTVPGLAAGDLPVGVSFIGRRWSEPLLLRAAYAFEQATRYRRRPKYLPMVDYPGC